MYPKVTASVTCYNLESKITGTIKCLIDQTYPNLQILIVDDGSTDNSLPVIHELAKSDSRIKVISQKNGGPAAARNTILDNAAGEYIHSADGDDQLHPRMIEILMEMVLANRASIAVCQAYRVKQDSFPPAFSEVKVEPSAVMTGRVGVHHLLSTNMYGYELWNKLFQTKLFDHVRFPTGRSFEDAAVVYQLFHEASVIATTATKLYYYRIHENSLTRNQLSLFTMKRLDILQNYDECFSFLKGHNYPLSLLDQVSASHFRSLRWMLIDLEQHPDPAIRKSVIEEVHRHLINYKIKLLGNKKLYAKEKLYLLAFLQFPQLISRLLRSRNTKIYKKNLKEEPA
ncbi:glycosyltransferase family 2 protein [Alkalicoccus luteus]|uniref:glycosyltransferase family 2 protein n=1 Tax=Alkalicoccus luteus TaxID=1237094 RepID=UPI004033EEF2